MPGAQEDRVARLEQQLGVELLRHRHVTRRRTDHEVKLAAQHGLVELGRGRLDHRDIDTREFHREPQQGFGEHVIGEERADADAQVAVGGVAEPLDLGARDACLADDGQRARQQLVAERTEFCAVPAADEKPGAEILLEARQARAQRLLRQVQLLGGAVQVAEPRDADEVPELPEFQRRPQAALTAGVRR